jgi:hypothetical protein
MQKEAEQGIGTEGSEYERLTLFLIVSQGSLL